MSYSSSIAPSEEVSAVHDPPGCPSTNGGSADTPEPVGRHALQRQARRNIRRHALRGLARFAVLASADAASLVLATLAIGLVAGFRPVLPELEPLSLAGIVTGLLLTGNYGRGDKRLSLWHLFTGLLAGYLIIRGQTLLRLDPTELLVAGIWLVTALTGLTLARVLVDQILRHFQFQSRHSARAVIVGPGVTEHPLVRSRLFGGNGSYTAVGAVLPPGSSHHPDLDVLGHYEDLDRVLERYNIESVFVTGYVPDDEFSNIVDVTLATGCELLSYARTFNLVGAQPGLRWCNGEPVIDLTRPAMKGSQLAGKRLVDVVLAGTALIVLSPVLLLIAALVKLTSRGPVFFRQERVGFGGDPFWILKFRSMTADAEERKAELQEESIYGDGRLFKVQNDPRVTRLGKFLRRTSLDELPQLINVVRGDMSLVGPRPPVPEEVALYEEHHYCRFDVKPGITGPWQVGGRNDITDFEEIVRLEQEYIRNWSPARDLKIMLKTIPVVLKMDGAH